MEKSETLKMGLVSCVALIIGACIGSAIFSISGVTIFFAGGSAILSWLIAAIVYMAYGMLLAELSSIYPDSGGIYLFPRRAIPGRFGTFLSFLSGWGYILSNIIAIGFSTIFIGTYFCSGFNIPLSPDVISVISLFLSVLIVIVGGKKSRTIQNSSVLILLLTLVLYCCIAFFGGYFNTSAFDNFFTSGVQGNAGILNAVPLAMVAYGGCVVIPFMVSEVRSPEKNVSRSLLLGLLVVAIIYMAVIAAIIGTLPMSLVKDDETSRMIPLFASASKGSLQNIGCSAVLSKILSLSGMIALMTTIIALLRVNSHTIQIMAMQGFLPSGLSFENRNGVKTNAVIVMTVIAYALFLIPQSTESMISLGAILNVVSISVTIMASLYSKKKSAGYKAPFGLFLPIAVLVIFLLCYVPGILSSRIWSILVFTIGIYLIGMAFYIPGREINKKRVTGIVVSGKGHGRLHGMPTANLSLFEGETAPNGVWCTTVFTDGRKMYGVTNVGLRPSDDDSTLRTVETFVLDYQGDLYGKRMTLQFDVFIRNTLSFSNLDELKQQVDKDIEFSRKLR